MTKERTKAAGLVAAGVVAGGILAGTLGAHAADETNGSTSDGTSQVQSHRGPGGPGGHGFFGGGADLAKALGVSEAKLEAALKAVRDTTQPTGKSAEKPDGPPSDSEREAQQEKFITALATELDLSEAKVKAALAEVRSAHEADRRDNLKDRLAAAVKAGKLTSGDQASVLKAYDAGVLEGGPRP